MSLTEALRAALTAVGIGAEDPPAASPADFFATVPEILTQQVGQLDEFIAGENDPQTLGGIEWRLQNLARQAAERSAIIQTAEVLAEQLPEINSIIANYDGPDFPVEDTYGAIRRVQSTLDVEIDGEFGPATARALTKFLTDNVNSDVSIVAELNIDDLHCLQRFLRTNASPEYSEYQTAAGLVEDLGAEIEIRDGALIGAASDISAQSTRMNEIIQGAITQCTGVAVDLNGEDPFGNIVQEITDQYAQTADEVAIAGVNVARVVAEQCGHFLEGADPDVVDEAITNIASLIETPLQEAVQERIVEARIAAEQSLIDLSTRRAENGNVAPFPPSK
ncbi:MAG: hypothetical protein AAGB32_04515 [Pseudomonadota bacterium]